MKKPYLFSCLAFVFALLVSGPSAAQDSPGLHVVKYDVNAESENAELCLEFDKPLAPTSPAHLASALHLEVEGKTIAPDNIASADTSFCLFPLERGKSYHLEVMGLRTTDDEKMAAPYKLSFIIPDRSPTLAFTGENGGVNGFDFYDNSLMIRAVNVPRAKIEVYRITDMPSLAHAWQERAETSLAPTESAYLARSKGQEVWHGEEEFDSAPNTTTEQAFSLRTKIPNLAPGLYLIVADAENSAASPANKGLSPLAAAWFTNANFSLNAIRDNDGIHVFTSKTDAIGAKTDLHLYAFNKKPEQVADIEGGGDGVSLIHLPSDAADVATVIGIDKSGGVAFADIGNLPTLSIQPALGTIDLNEPFVMPGQDVDVSLSQIPTEVPAKAMPPSLLHLSFADHLPWDFPVPSFTAQEKTAFPAPVVEGQWVLHWQKTDGTMLAEHPLRVTLNPDLPHLEVQSQRDILGDDGVWPITIKSLSNTGKPMPFMGGKVLVTWQKLDPATFGWKDYHFGMPKTLLDTPVPVADFITDDQGTAQIHVVLPKPPQDRGLYQASLKVIGEPDAGVAETSPLVLPLKPDVTMIGIKSLASDARFPQNGIARFALIGLSSDGKPRDVSGLSYQVYEEGRRFSWYQDEGRWKYKPADQLRPIGGGALSIKGDASSILEWPVTAGNYRLEILDSSGKHLAEATFSASWDSTGSILSPVLPLNISLPKSLSAGHEVSAHVTLPEAAMLTAVIGDTHIRKIIHEPREKGDNLITFTPESDWNDRISVSVKATPIHNRKTVMRGEAEAAIAERKTSAADISTEDVSILTPTTLPALRLHKANTTTLIFGIINNRATTETYHYTLLASQGLTIGGDAKGSFALNGHQSRSLPISLEGTQAGVKDLRLDITGSHGQHINHSWSIAVLQDANMVTDQTLSAAPKQPLMQTTKHLTADTSILVARRPMDGLAEILSYVFNAHPFTTNELALTIDALRLWSDVITQIDLAPDFVISAHRKRLIEQLLRHQNSDGGFAAYRDGESTMDDTAAALIALGPERTGLVPPAKAQAVAWIKQHLANTWVDEKERAPRAAAYAGLAAADAIDPASLHYFSDTSAPDPLPSLAEINIAAAFKHMGDPNAAAFWIKKMLDENGHPKSIPLLNALAATDALSSDDVHAAMADMLKSMRDGSAPQISDAAGLLRAIAADNVDAGKEHITIGNQAHDLAGVMGLHGTDIANAHNNDTQNLFVTFVDPHEAPVYTHEVMRTRHIYRLNGVELAPSAKPMRDEPYIIELKGEIPSAEDNETVLVQDSSNAIRPLGCALSSKLENLSFIPWFTPHELTDIKTCEFSSHQIDAVLASTDDSTFSVVYFAYIDADTISNLPAPNVKILK